MPVPRVISQTGTGATGWVNPNWYMAPFQVTLNIETTGTVTYNVETTNDNYWTYPVGTVNVYVNNTGSTSAAEVSLTNAVTGLRLNVTAGTGSVTAQIVQAGITNM